MNSEDQDKEQKLREFASYLAAAFLDKDENYIDSACSKIRGGKDMYYSNISSYPNQLTPPDPSRKELFWIIKIDGKMEWRVDTFFSLPSGENSDLDLRITIREAQNKFVAEVEDILVP